MEITSYISINLLLFSSLYCFLYLFRGSISFADRLIGTFVLGLTQIISTEMVLGVLFSSLRPVPLFTLNLFLSLVFFAYSLSKGKCTGLISEAAGEMRYFSELIRKDFGLGCMCILFLSAVAWMIFIAFLFPSYAWDALYYHLPIVAQIIQGGTIQETVTPSFIQQYMNIFSKDINLFYLWNIIFLNSDEIVDLGQFFFVLAGCVSVYSMAVKLGVGKKYAIYASMVFFFTPMLILQATVNYVDAAVSMMFLIAVNYLIIYRDDTSSETAESNNDNMQMVLAGLSTGILLASKPTGPLFCFMIFMALFVRGVVRYRNCKQDSPTTGGCSLLPGLRRFVLYFIFPVFTIGGYWYIRNWILHGNPVYYMDITLFGKMIFKGLKSDWVESSPAIIEQSGYLRSLIHVWLEKVEYYLYDSRFSGFGATWFILLLPSLFVSLYIAVRKKNYNYLFIFILIAATFIVHPRNWTNRYVLFIVGLGAVSFGVVMQHLQKREAVLKAVALVLVIYSFLVSNSPCIMPSQVMEFAGIPSSERTLTRLKPFNIDSRVRDQYGYWIWIENNIKPGETLAYTYVDTGIDEDNPFFMYTFWNRDLSSKVVYVSGEKYNVWLSGLENRNVNYILYRSGSQHDKWVEKERKMFYSLSWMGNVKEKFKIVYSDDKYKVAKFYGSKKLEG